MSVSLSAKMKALLPYIVSEALLLDLVCEAVAALV